MQRRAISLELNSSHDLKREAFHSYETDRRSLVSGTSLAAKASFIQAKRGSNQRRRLKSGAPYLGLGRLSYSSGDELDADDDYSVDDHFEYWEDAGQSNGRRDNHVANNNSSNEPVVTPSSPRQQASSSSAAVEEPTIQVEQAETTESSVPCNSDSDEEVFNYCVNPPCEAEHDQAPIYAQPRTSSDADQEDYTEYESPYSLHIVPVRENRLLRNELFQSRRRSRSVGDLTQMLKIEQVTGLFQKARATRMQSCGLTSANKPPIAAKPIIPKKPQPHQSKSQVSKPVAYKPATHNLATDGSNNHGNNNFPPLAKLQSHDDENHPMHIYDEVYHEEPQFKDLKKFFGQTPTPGTTPIVQSEGFFSKFKGQGKSLVPPPPNTNVPKKKHSRTKTHPQPKVSDDPNPYAISPPLHSEKDKKGLNRRKKTSQTSADRSGDSGIAPGIQMLEVPKNRVRYGGSTKSEDSDFGSTVSDSESWDDEEWDLSSESQREQQAPKPENFINESHKVAYEVLTSERTYVDRLNLLDQVFLARIERENERAHWFSPEVTRDIFSNLRSIYAFHQNFLLPDLEKRLKEWEENPSIGDILKRLAPFLMLYSDYVSNFANAVKLLNNWSIKAPKFGQLLTDIQRRPECMNLALQHHMLEPVQRIPRYELLLKDYLKRLPLDSPDRQSAQEAKERIAQAANHSNNMMKTTDQFQALLKLNEKIEGEDIIDPSRALIKEGKITKIPARGGHKVQEMYLFLFNDMMLCCIRGKILKRVTFTVKVRLDVDGMKILDSENCKFIVESKQKSLELQATSEEEKEEWMKAIISAVHEMVRKKQTFLNNDAMNDRPPSQELADEACEIGTRAPRWIKDEEVTMCMRCGTDFKAITRRRHHCRACGAVVCHKCSNYEAELAYDDYKVNRVCYQCFYSFRGEEEGAKEQLRRSLITEIDESNSYSSYLSILQKREWVRFWVVATKQDLFALKAPKDVRPVLTLPIKLYSVVKISESDNIDRPHAFILSDGGRSQHIFAADSLQLKKRWLMVFNDGLESVLQSGSKYMTCDDSSDDSS